MPSKVDQFMCARAKRKGGRFASTYDVRQAVQSRELLNVNAPRFCVLFPPWHGGGPAYDLLALRLARNGSAVLKYGFHDQILEPDVDRVKASFINIQQTVKEDVELLHGTGLYNKMRFVSLSLGTVPLAMAARVCPAFSSAAIVVGRSNLALSTWDGDRTQSVKRAMEANGVTLPQLERDWVDLAPSTYADCFDGKSVDFIVSDPDRVVPVDHQNELVTCLQAAGADVTIRHTKLGHYMAAAQYCLTGK